MPTPLTQFDVIVVTTWRWRILSVLRNRNFLILFSGQIVSVVGNNLYSIALGWYVLSTTGSRGDLALVGLAQSLPGIAGLFVGVFVDRWLKKSTMIWSDILRALIAFAMFAIAITTKSNFLWLLVLVLLLRLVGTVYGPASGAILPLVMKKEDIPASVGLQQSASSVAQLGGMVGGGALMAVLGAPLLFLSNAISFVVSVISLFFVKSQEERKPSTIKSSFFREWGDGFRVIARSKMILVITVAAAIANFAGAPYDVLLTAWTKQELHANVFEFSVVNACFLVGAIGGGLMVGPAVKRLKTRTMLLTGFCGMGASIALTGAIPSLLWMYGVAVVAGIGMGLLNGALGSMILMSVPRHVLGRVGAPLQALATIASPVGMGLFGALMVHIQLPILFGVLGLCSIFSGLSFLLPIEDDVTAMSEAM